MITKEQWHEYSPDQKAQEITVRLDELISIDKGRHPLYNKKEQGKLTNIKKELTDFILTTISWESEQV